MQIPPFTMRHEIAEALVWPFHAEIGTFHLSYGEYAILPLDWIAILGIRFGDHRIPIEEMTFEMASKLLGIPLPLIAETGGISGPLNRHRFVLSGCCVVFLGNCFLGNNRSVLTC